MDKLVYSSFIKSFKDKLNEKANKDGYNIETVGVKVQDARYTLLDLTKDGKSEGNGLNALIPYLIYFNSKDMESTANETYELIRGNRKSYSEQLISKIHPDIYEYAFLIKSVPIQNGLGIKSKDGNYNRLYFLLPGDFGEVPDSQKARYSIVTKEFLELLNMDPIETLKRASENTTLLALIMKKDKEIKKV